jgi:hypothetical protein
MHHGLTFRLLVSFDVRYLLHRWIVGNDVFDTDSFWPISLLVRIATKELPISVCVRHQKYRTLMGKYVMADVNGQVVWPKGCHFVSPNGLRLSGERSGAERVRCSRGLGHAAAMTLGGHASI